MLRTLAAFTLASKYEMLPGTVGSQINPMSDEQLCAKFFSLVSRILSPQDSERLWTQCWNLEELPAAGAIPESAALRQ